MSGVQRGSAICPLNTLSGGHCVVSGHLFERQTHRRPAPSSVRWFSCKEDSSLLRHQKPIEKHRQRRQIQNQTKPLKTHQRPHTSPGGIPKCWWQQLLLFPPVIPPTDWPVSKQITSHKSHMLLGSPHSLPAAASGPLRKGCLLAHLPSLSSRPTPLSWAKQTVA